jgi:hypothetical protein
MVALVAFASYSPGGAEATAEVRATAGPSTVTDLDGVSVDPFAKKESKAVVLIFVVNDCPVSNRYAPEIRRISARCSSLGVAFFLVHPDPDETAQAIRSHAEQYQYSMAILRDPKHVLVRRAGAVVTPEAAVFLPGGQLVYSGRIDNRYVDFGKERPAASKHDLEEVLDRVLKGGRIGAPTRTNAVGCYIPAAQ